MANSINLEKLPATVTDYIWADYLELLCLFNIDGQVTLSELLDRIIDRREIESVTKDLLGWNNKSRGEMSDILEQKSISWIGQIKFREKKFKDHYPFTLTRDSKLLQIKSSDIRRVNKYFPYLYLLICSNLRYFRGSIQKLTNYFELISKEALNTYLNGKAEVEIFGSNPLSTGRFSEGNIYTKIKKLADSLDGRVWADEDHFSKYSSGDKGLDIVAWLPFKDRSDGKLIVFGQSACTEEWIDKQHSSSLLAWMDIINTKAKHVNAVFIPFDYRNSDGDWHDITEIHNSILFDRWRLLSLIDSKSDLVEKIYSSQLKTILEKRESLF
mgnify:CR=1 FL=1